MTRILIVDDEPRITAFLARGLRGQGFVTTVVDDGQQASLLARDGDFELVLLDVGLPIKDGFQVLEEIRARGERLPVILLTARDEVRDRVLGLEIGADDYLGKPFSFQELLARIRARLRDAGTAGKPSALEAGPLRLDLLTRTATVDGRMVELTAQEFTLAETFVRHAGQVLSRAQLLDMAWGYDFDPGSNVVESTSATSGASSAATCSARCGAWGTSCRCGRRRGDRRHSGSLERSHARLTLISSTPPTLVSTPRNTDRHRSHLPMKTPLRLAAATALTFAAGIAIAPAAQAGDFECRGTIGASTVVGSVIVPDDATCILDGTVVQGGIVVKSRATLVATGVETTGTISGESPTTVEIRNSEVGNGVSLSKGGEFGSLSLTDTHVTGDVQFADNRGTVAIERNTVGGSIQANKNTGGLNVAGNNIVNGLQCQDNTPFPTGGSNVAAQKQGQCERL